MMLNDQQMSWIGLQNDWFRVKEITEMKLIFHYVAHSPFEQIGANIRFEWLWAELSCSWF